MFLENGNWSKFGSSGKGVLIVRLCGKFGVVRNYGTQDSGANG